jgi:hypothetical protein
LLGFFVPPEGFSITSKALPPHPLFFVSVADKGFSVSVTLLDATLMSDLGSVADKRLTGVGVGLFAKA